MEKRLTDKGRSLRNYAGKIKFAVVGKKTSESLSSLGIKADFVPPNFVAESLLENLNSAKNKIRFLLSQRVQMRRIPDLVFKIDRVLDQGLAVLKVLDQLREKNDSKN